MDIMTFIGFMVFGSIGLFLMGIAGLFTGSGHAAVRFKRAIGLFVVAFIMAGIFGKKDGSTETPVASQESELIVNEVAEPVSAEAEPAAEESEPEERVYYPGESVLSGNFQYIISDLYETESIASNNQFIESKETEGKFVVIDYTVKNVDKEARMVDSALFQILDANGNEYEPMVDGDIFMLLGDKNLFLENVNPGMSRNGQVVFEVPLDINRYNLELSSGIGWAGGTSATVQLR